MSGLNDVLDEIRAQCLSDPDELVWELQAALNELPAAPVASLQAVMRALHALKGNLQGAGFASFGAFVHDLEGAIAPHLSAVEAGGPPAGDNPYMTHLESRIADAVKDIDSHFAALRANPADAASLHGSRKRSVLALEELPAWREVEPAGPGSAPREEASLQADIVEEPVAEGPRIHVLDEPHPQPSAPPSAGNHRGLYPPTAGTVQRAGRDLYLVVRNEEKLYGLKVEHVSEIVESFSMNPLAFPHPVVAGFVVYRGEPLTIVKSREFPQRTVSGKSVLVISRLDAGIIAEDHEHKVVFVNDDVASLFNLPMNASHLLGCSSFEVAESMKHLFADSEAFVAGVQGTVARMDKAVNQEVHLADGRIFERDYVPTTDSGQCLGHLWIYRDVTKKRETERLIEAQRVQLVNASKMSALGEMAGGIAHEINNPLMVIQGRSQYLKALIKRERLDAASVWEAAEAIEMTSKRLAKIVRGLRTFAKDGERDPYEKVCLKRIVDETLSFCSERFKSKNVQLRAVNVTPNLFIMCRPVPVSQVLLNLLNNAYDAVCAAPDPWIEIAVREGGGRRRAERH